MASSEFSKPYRLGPNDPKGCAGAVIIHGFTGLPWDVLPIGQNLETAAFAVDIPLLAGHAGGTSGIAEASLQAWRAGVRESAERLFEATGRPVFLAGLSMGGLLAIDLALAGTVPVAAVASLAAPLRLGRAARGMSKLANTQDWAESFSWPKFRGSDIANRLHMPGADGIPFKALSQLEELIEDVRSGLPRLSQPLLIVQSRHDHTSPPESPWEIASLTASSYTKLVILKRGFHIITRDICCEQVAQEVRQFAERFCVHESQTQNKAQNKG